MQKIQNNNSRISCHHALASANELDKLKRYQQPSTIIFSPVPSVSLFSYSHTFDIIILLMNLMSILIIFHFMDFPRHTSYKFDIAYNCF